MNFVSFSVIHISQGSVATYVRYGGMSTALYSNFPAESVSERIFKKRLRFDKVTAKVWGLGYLEHGVVLAGPPDPPQHTLIGAASCLTDCHHRRIGCCRGV